MQIFESRATPPLAETLNLLGLAILRIVRRDGPRPD